MLPQDAGRPEPASNPPHRRVGNPKPVAGRIEPTLLAVPSLRPRRRPRWSAWRPTWVARAAPGGAAGWLAAAVLCTCCSAAKPPRQLRIFA